MQERLILLLDPRLRATDEVVPDPHGAAIRGPDHSAGARPEDGCRVEVELQPGGEEFEPVGGRLVLPDLDVRERHAGRDDEPGVLAPGADEVVAPLFEVRRDRLGDLGEDKRCPDPVHLLVGGLIGVVDSADDVVGREAVGPPGGERGARVADDREVLELVQGERVVEGLEDPNSLLLHVPDDPRHQRVGGGLEHAEGPRRLSEGDRRQIPDLVDLVSPVPEDIPGAFDAAAVAHGVDPRRLHARVDPDALGGPGDPSREVVDALQVAVLDVDVRRPGKDLREEVDDLRSEVDVLLEVVPGRLRCDLRSGVGVLARLERDLAFCLCAARNAGFFRC